MGNEFVQPNWHVILIHYPLGLLTIGVVIEVLSCFWRRSTVRQAGRWMILIGALACIPTLTIGMYAFRHVVVPGPFEDETWRQLSARSSWNAEQWEAMSHHIWFTASGTAVAILAAFVWLACSERGRQRLHWPALILMIAALGLLDVGAWHAGEGVYRYRVAVQNEPSPIPRSESAEKRGSALENRLLPTTAAATAPTTQRSVSESVTTVRNETAETDAGPGRGSPRREIDFYVPRLELHLLLAGTAIAIALAAFAVTIRRWARTREMATPVSSPVDLPEHRLRSDFSNRPSAPAEPSPGAPLIPQIFPARLWLWALIFAISTAASGLWMTGDWRLKVLTEPMHNRFALDQTQRLFGHVAVGSSIALLLLIGAVLTRLARRHRPLTVLVMLLATVAVASQMWLGVLLLFDSSSGPVTKFN